MSATPVARLPLRRPWASRLTGMASSALVLAGTWWWLEQAAGRLPDVDRNVFMAINGWPDWVRAVAWPVMQLGNVWVWLVASVVAWVVWRRPAPVISVASATLLAWFLAKVVKDLVGRARPSELVPDAVVRDGALEGLGFVSGHAAVSFALATALWPWFARRWEGVVAYALAIGVSIARVYVGAHLPLDVVGGAAVGVLCGLTVQLVVGVPDRNGTAGDGAPTAEADAP